MQMVILIILVLGAAWLFISVITVLLKLIVMIVIPASVIFIAYVVWKKA